MSDNIDISTEEGRARLAELAAEKPVFRVLHACDQQDIYSVNEETK